MNRFVLLLSSLLLFASSCTKTEDPVSAEEDLRSGTWKRTSGRVTFKDPQTRGDSTRDYLPEVAQCRLDNTLQFKVNYTGVMNMGKDRCVAGEPDTKNFTWQVFDNGQRISIYNAGDYFPTDAVDADILTRTLGYLTLRYRVINVDPVFQTSDTLIYTDVLRRN